MQQVRHAAREQLGLVSIMAGRPDLFIPMFAIWVASFGGALHAPVTTYFQMEVGATTEQIGNFGVIRTAGVILVSPVYGWLLDKRSAYVPAVLSAFCCTFGCLFHGFAPDTTGLYVANAMLALGAVNFWNVVGAYVAIAMPRDQRSLVVSGYQVQVGMLKLLGTSLYPSWDSLLIACGVDDKLFRYRIHMSICSFFCVFGFFYMVFRFKPVARTESKENSRESEKLDEPINMSQLLLLLITLMVQAFGETVVTVLWPMHIRKLGWDSHEYANLLLASQLLVIIGTMGYPALTRVLGSRMLASALPLAASFTSAVAFAQSDASLYGQSMHVFNALGFLAVSGIMKVCFQHLTTLAVPAALQGRIFSLLNVLSSVGAIGGNLFGTRFSEHETSYTGKGATPFLLASALFCTVGLAVVGLLIVPASDCFDIAGSKVEDTSKDEQ
mmetsp:Transcript_136106/g.261468  ORF Transcript_136106/g.261468 Transcript_136106/m.261468 type:complete len:441 (+) Transcript_136106:71-1393(+)